MAISDLQNLKNVYSSTNASTMLPEFFTALIIVLEGFEGRITTLEAQMDNRMLCTEYKTD